MDYLYLRTPWDRLCCKACLPLLAGLGELGFELADPFDQTIEMVDVGGPVAGRRLAHLATH
jgi:hypothetical protein